ncbi:uncharacterized protein [Excalfactoria chinensis]|uniref:uncharacterized protein n=1 Tax=Excalfactoria chinensis TaxID=46218 RepID=UPI003B3AF2B3
MEGNVGPAWRPNTRSPALPGHRPRHCDSSGLNCDLTDPRAEAGAQQSPASLVPGLRLSAVARLGAANEPLFGPCCGAAGSSSWCSAHGIASVPPALPGSGSRGPAGCARSSGVADSSCPLQRQPREQLSHLGSPQPTAQPGAMEPPSDWSCPLCGQSRDDAAYAVPCRHQLCLGCALRWAKQQPTCAVCKESIESIRYSVRSEDDFLECPIPQPAQHSEDEQEDEQGSAQPQLVAAEHGFPAEVWADFFRGDPGDLGPLLRWIQQELEGITEDEWWEVAAARTAIMHLLCVYGLDEDALILSMETHLEEHTERFVAGLIDTVTALYGPELRRRQHSQAAREAGGQDGPADTPSPATSQQEPPASGPGRSASPAGPGAEQLPGVPPGGPEPQPAAPVSPQEPQEEPGQAAAAGPSAQGTDRSPGGPRRPPKRRASSCPPDSPPPSPKRRR